MTVSHADRALSPGPATLHEAAGRPGALPARLKPAFHGSRFAGHALPVLSPAGAPTLQPVNQLEAGR
jgi:hypothetical protein